MRARETNDPYGASRVSNLIRGPSWRELRSGRWAGARAHPKSMLWLEGTTKPQPVPDVANDKGQGHRNRLDTHFLP